MGLDAMRLAAAVAANERMPRAARAARAPRRKRVVTQTLLRSYDRIGTTPPSLDGHANTRLRFDQIRAQIVRGCQCCAAWKARMPNATHSGCSQPSYAA